MEHDEHYTERLFMQRAFTLAGFGRGRVSPNPMVGCVIVHEGRIIGEGWHQRYGEAHAEVNAVKAVEDQSLLAESTVYVTLEPCSHTGKTPPCADMLVSHGVKKVIIANDDPNPLVAGRGIQKLRAAGAEVLTGLLAAEGRFLNRRFFTYMEKKRPYVILKYARTADGFMARENFDAKWISNAYARQLVHKWRAEEDAILVGTQTARYDDPQLNVRDWSGRNPVRVVIDRYLKLPPTLQVFDGTQPTLCYNTLREEARMEATLIRLPEEDFLPAMLQDMYRRKVQSVIIEGGAQVLQAFIDAGLWDEARIVTAPKTFGRGIAAPVLYGNLIAHESVCNDTLEIYTPHDEKSKH